MNIIQTIGIYNKIKLKYSNDKIQLIVAIKRVRNFYFIGESGKVCESIFNQKKISTDLSQDIWIEKFIKKGYRLAIIESLN